MDREELEDEIDDLRDKISNLKHENAALLRALTQPWDEKSSLRQLQARAEVAEAACDRMRSAIKQALADAESGRGWGPDITVCEYLRAALVTPNVELTGDPGTPGASG